jgi:hypothetical protein
MQGGVDPPKYHKGQTVAKLVLLPMERQACLYNIQDGSITSPLAFHTGVLTKDDHNRLKKRATLPSRGSLKKR